MPLTATMRLPGSTSAAAWSRRGVRRGGGGLRPGAFAGSALAHVLVPVRPLRGLPGRWAHAGCAGAGRRGHPHHRQHRGDPLLARRGRCWRWAIPPGHGQAVQRSLALAPGFAPALELLASCCPQDNRAPGAQVRRFATHRRRRLRWLRVRLGSSGVDPVQNTYQSFQDALFSPESARARGSCWARCWCRAAARSRSSSAWPARCWRWWRAVALIGGVLILNDTHWGFVALCGVVFLLPFASLPFSHRLQADLSRRGAGRALLCVARQAGHRPAA